MIPRNPTPEMPVLFVSHGAPLVALEGDRPFARSLREVALKLPLPRAILVMSAHWQTSAPSLTVASANSTIHDFYGFPKPLYDLTYPAPGSPEVASEAAELLRKAGLPAQTVNDRGLDHGAWVPLRLMFPEASIPVLQISLPSLSPGELINLGKALRPLRRHGVLLVASGGAVHNLRRINFASRDASPESWARSISDGLREASTGPDSKSKIARFWEALRPEAASAAHPTTEHLFPVFFAAGATHSAERAHVVFDGFDYGNLSMLTLAWG